MPKGAWFAAGLVAVAGAVTVGALALRDDKRAVPTAATPPAEVPAQIALIAPVDEPAPQPPPPVPPAPAEPSLSELPVQDVESRTVHAVPEGETVAVPHVT